MVDRGEDATHAGRRVVPRYSTHVACQLRFDVERRFRKPRPVAVDGLLAELSVVGAAIEVRRPGPADGLRKGRRITVVAGDARTEVRIRHREESTESIRLGVEFLETSPDFEAMINQTVESRRGDGGRLRNAWNRAS